MKSRWIAMGALALPLAGQAPQVSNARVETRAVTAGLEQEFRGLMAAPAWIGYMVPAVPGHEQTCDFQQGIRAPGPVHLEPPSQVNILYRVEQGKVVRIRTLSPDCALDAGGLPFYWLTGVRPAESVALLESMGTDGAVTAIALHGVPEADAALEKLAAPDRPLKVREKAVFWMGAARGRRGFEDLRRLARGDADERLREKAIFALSVSKEPEAVEEIIRLARQDQSPRVRGQALFWLAHKAGRKAVAAITDAVANDPETEVKKRAVFALQQLPDGEGVPLLIQVAKTNRNPAVRKQAIFWLGQSHDPRAVDFFEEVLK